MNTHNWQATKIENSKHQDKISLELNNLNYISRNKKIITLEDNNEYTEFISCSYLGLDQHPDILKAAMTNLTNIGGIFSAAKSRMKPAILEELEHELNKVFHAHTITFTSTHLATLGILPLIASGKIPSFKHNGRVKFFMDSFAHASIQINRGLLSQFGEIILVDFTNLNFLESLLKLESSKMITPILLTDSVRSMGIALDIENIIKLVNQYNGVVYFDDAHGMSIFGKTGAGYVLDCLGYLPPRVIIGTSLAKGFGTSGGVIIVPTEKDKSFIRTHCSTYIFSGSFYNTLIYASIASTKIHLSNELAALQNDYFSNLKYFDSLLPHNIIRNHQLYTTPIRGIHIGDEYTAIKVATQLKQSRYLVTVSSYPIVKKGEAMLRVLIAANHTKKDIHQFSQQVLKILPVYEKST